MRRVSVYSITLIPLFATLYYGTRFLALLLYHVTVPIERQDSGLQRRPERSCEGAGAAAGRRGEP